MSWVVVFGIFLLVVLGTVVLMGLRPRDPYDRTIQPREAPPRGSPGRRWWRRNARKGDRPGSPL